VSAATAALLDAGVELVDLGTHCLKGITVPERILQVGRAEFPPLRVENRLLGNLPAPASGMVGREEELTRTRELLTRHRLVTLTGVGGSGKTRLALAVAEAEQARFGHGCYFVDLAAVADADDVVAAVARGLLLTLGSGEPTQQVLNHLSDKHALLVLDNCEHVVDGCAEFAEAFLASPGRSRILATSREHLGVDGESQLQVPSLPFDGPGAAAVTLFVQRAMAVDPSFDAGEAGMAAIEEICRRLDGVPLAIELAAARTAVMTPEELAGRLDDRFRLLAGAGRRGGGRRGRDRRRSLEATIDWSYDLLDDREREFFRRCAVFVGGFRADDAAAVCGVEEWEALDIVESLAAKSLLASDQVDGVTWFRLLETIRAYGQDRLVEAGEVTAVHDAHLDWCVARFGTDGLRDHESAAELDVLIRHRQNLIAAADWAEAAGRVEDAARLLLGGMFIWAEGLLPPRQGLNRALQVAARQEDAVWRDRLSALAVVAGVAAGDDAQSIELARGLRTSDDAEARAIGCAFHALFLAVPPDEARDLLEEALDAAVAVDVGRDRQRRFCLLMAKGSAASRALYVGQIAEAAEMLAGTLPDIGLMSGNLTHQLFAIAAIVRGEPQPAVHHSRQIDPSSRWGTRSLIEGMALLEAGDLEGGRRLVLDAAEEATLGRVARLANEAAVGLAVLALHLGDVQLARDCLDAAGLARTPTMIAFAREVAARAEYSEQQLESQMAALFAGGPDRSREVRALLPRFGAPDSTSSEAG
jgi:predicted ATPase